MNLTLIKPIQLHIYHYGTFSLPSDYYFLLLCLLFTLFMTFLSDLLPFGAMFLSPPPPPVTLFPYTFPSLYIPLPHTSLLLPPSSPPALSSLYILLLSLSFLSSDLLCFGDATDSRGQKSIREEVPRSHHFCYQRQAPTDNNQIRWSFKSKSHISLDIIFISSTHCISSQL